MSDKKCECDSAEAMPKLQEYLVWLQGCVGRLSEAAGIPMPAKPEVLEAQSLVSSGGTGGTGRTAGWGNGSWP